MQTPSLYALWVLVTRIPALIFGGIMEIGVYTSPGDLLLGNVNLPERDERKMIFSPFGLGVLDLSVADLVRKKISKSESRLSKHPMSYAVVPRSRSAIAQ
jgi:hypothetical protein